MRLTKSLIPGPTPAVGVTGPKEGEVRLGVLAVEVGLIRSIVSTRRSLVTLVNRVNHRVAVTLDGSGLLIVIAARPTLATQLNARLMAERVKIETRICP